MAENEEVRNLAAALPHLVESIETFLRDQDVTDKALVGPVGVKGKRLIREVHEMAADMAAILHEIKFLPPPESSKAASYFGKAAASYFGRTAGLVTMKDLQDYFKGRWDGDFSSGGFEGTYQGENFSYVAKIIPKGVTFYYKIWATEDPADSEEGVSDEPMKSLAEFVGQGLPGGEHFEKMSSSREALRRAAARTANRKVLRRISSILASAALRTADAGEPGRPGKDEISDLLQQMKSKGWRAQKSETKDGEPSIEVEIGDQFEAVIEFSDINYDYEFEIEGHPDLTKNGVTDDPIREFQNFYRSPDVESLYEEAKSKKEELQSEKTIPSAGRKPRDELQNDKTVPSSR